MFFHYAQPMQEILALISWSTSVQACLLCTGRRWHTKAASIKRNLNLPFPAAWLELFKIIKGCGLAV
jgi:hypothetical protein